MKNFVRGMGVGILITTLVFAIAYMLKGNEISDDEIRQRAAKLGMVEEDTQVVKPKEATSQAVGAEGSNLSNHTVQPGTSQAVTDVSANQGYNTVVATPDALQTEAALSDYTTPLSGDSVKIQIVKGQDGITISQILQQGGVIADAADFNRYLSDNRLQLNILWGDFILQKNMAYEAIVDRIIAK